VAYFLGEWVWVGGISGHNGNTNTTAIATNTKHSLPIINTQHQQPTPEVIINRHHAHLHHLHQRALGKFIPEDRAHGAPTFTQEAALFATKAKQEYEEANRLLARFVPNEAEGKSLFYTPKVGSGSGGGASSFSSAGPVKDLATAAMAANHALAGSSGDGGGCGGKATKSGSRSIGGRGGAGSSCGGGGGGGGGASTRGRTHQMPPRRRQP
jgi:hypothetical protein